MEWSVEETAGWASLRSWTEADGVHVYLTDGHVLPEYQRRGVASALLARGLAGIDGPARLRTEAHDPSGARTLYERFGFRVTESLHRYRKPLRRDQ